MYRQPTSEEDARELGLGARARDLRAISHELRATSRDLVGLHRRQPRERWLGITPSRERWLDITPVRERRRSSTVRRACE